MCIHRLPPAREALCRKWDCVCVLSLSLSSIYCDRKGSSETWLERDLKAPADICHEKPHSFLYPDTQLSTLDSLVPAFEESVFQIWEQCFATDRWEGYDEQELWKSSVQRTGLEGTAFCLFEVFILSGFNWRLLSESFEVLLSFQDYK